MNLLEHAYHHAPLLLIPTKISQDIKKLGENIQSAHPSPITVLTAAAVMYCSGLG